MRKAKKAPVRSRSTFEAKIMKDLEERGIQYEYETLQLKYVKYSCPKCKCEIKRGTYTPDFIIGDRVIEAKGYFPSTVRTKMLNVKRDNPSIKLFLLFQKNNTISKKSKTTYLEWAKQHDFIAAVGNSVPEEWLHGI